jgi:predicted DNA-binding transcriptional regulator YafY
VLRLLSDPSGRAFSIKELADQLAVTKSTIERDLATLEHDFALVEEMADKQKRLYRIDQSIRALDAIRFGTTELLALHGALAGLHPLAGTPLHDDLARVAAKLRGFLSPHHNGGLDAMTRVFLPHARGHIDYSGQSELIDDLSDAIARRRVCRVVYYAAWKKTTREHRVRPLRLVWHRSSLYLLGCVGAKRDITTLAVHRIRELEVTGERLPGTTRRRRRACASRIRHFRESRYGGRRGHLRRGDSVAHRRARFPSRRRQGTPARRTSALPHSLKRAVGDHPMGTLFRTACHPEQSGLLASSHRRATSGDGSSVPRDNAVRPVDRGGCSGLPLEA